MLKDRLCSVLCTENDSYPDIGKASRYTVIDASDLEGDFSVTFPVTVTEGHGRYAGCAYRLRFNRIYKYLLPNT